MSSSAAEGAGVAMARAMIAALGRGETRSDRLLVLGIKVMRRFSPGGPPCAAEAELLRALLRRVGADAGDEAAVEARIAALEAEHVIPHATLHAGLEALRDHHAGAQSERLSAAHGRIFESASILIERKGSQGLSLVDLRLEAKGGPKKERVRRKPRR